MSGLTTFFRHLLPPSQEGGQPPEQENNLFSVPSDAAYTQSLSCMGLPAQENSENSHHEPNASRTDAAAASPPGPTFSTHKEWRDCRSQQLTQFMQIRIDPYKPEEDDEGEDYYQQVPENDLFLVPFMDTSPPSYSSRASVAGDVAETQECSDPTDDVETQPMVAAGMAETDQETTSLFSPMKQRRVVPHVDDSTEECSSIHSLSLYTKNFELELGQINLVWPYRRVRRAEWQDALGGENSERKQKKNANSAAKISKYKTWENDGPLDSLFRHVLSMEVQELGSTTEAQEAAAAAFEEVRQKRIFVFFYNDYASQMKDALEEFHAPCRGKKNNKIALSIFHVPAKCIYPFKASQSHNNSAIPCLLDQEYGSVSNYCLCIGDESYMLMENNNTCKKEKSWFDSEQLEVRLSNGKKEYVVNAETIRQGRHQTESPEGPLTLRYVQWKKKVEEEEARQRDSADTLNETVTRQGTAVSDAASCAQATSVGDVIVERNTATTEDGPPDRAKKQRAVVQCKPLNELQRILDALRAQKQQRQPGENTNQRINDSVNIFGAVIGFTPPSLTKASQWCMSVTLVDESLPLPESDASACAACVTLVIFTSDREKLPKLLLAGDVLRAHRVTVQEWQGELQLLGRMCSSYVVVRPKSVYKWDHNPNFHVEDGENSDETWDVLPTAQTFFHWTPEDSAQAKHLWAWGQRRILAYPTMKLVARSTVSKMGGQDCMDEGAEFHGDLTGMVAAIIPIAPQERDASSPRGFLRFWDGTGPPLSDPLPLATSEASDAVKHGDPPTEAVVSIGKAVDEINFRVAARDTDGTPANRKELIAPVGLCGRVINVVVWEEPHWELIESTIKVGTFIRLRNVYERRLKSGLKCLFMASRASLTPLPEATFEVRSLLEKHHERVLRKEPVNPLSGLLPLVGAAAAAACTTELEDTSTQQERIIRALDASYNAHGKEIARLAQCIGEPAPAVFLSRFCITRTFPSMDKDDGLSVLCTHDRRRRKQIFQFAFCVNNNTAEIDLVVSNQVAEFLLGIKATGLEHEKQRGAETLFKLMDPGFIWEGCIKSVEIYGSKFFLVESMNRCQV